MIAMITKPRHADPPTRALDWVRSVLGVKAIESVRALTGGADHAVHAIMVSTPSGARVDVVLRRWVQPSDPDFTVEREALALELVEALPIATPRFVASDPEARHCDVPALIMSLLPGHEPRPTQETLGSFVRELAQAAAAIHRAARADELPPYRPYNDLLHPIPPPSALRLEVWERAFRSVAAGAPAERACLIHRDFHHQNTLWSDDRLAGVVDWSYASFGPAAIDVSHMRWNLLLAYGQTVADDFLTAYVAEQPAFEYHPYWDLRTVVDLCPEPGHEPLVSQQTGCLEEHLERALARV